MIGRAESMVVQELREIWGSIDTLIFKGVSSAHSLTKLVGLARRCDLVVAQEPVRLIGLASLFASSIGGAPLVVELHGDYLSPKYLSVIDRGLALAVLRRASLVRVVNFSLLRKVMAMGFKASLIPSIYVDLEVFRPMRRPEDRDPLLLFAGRLVAEKRLDLLLAGFKELLGYVADARLRIVGTGPELASVTMMADRLGIAKRVEIVNRWLSRRELAREYCEAAVNVCTSISEGGPRTVFEAAACLTPSVSTRVGLAAEVLRHGESIMLLDSAEPRAFAETASSLLLDCGLRARIANAARSVVTELFERYKSAKRYAEAYLCLAKGRAV